MLLMLPLVLPLLLPLLLLLINGTEGIYGGKAHPTQWALACAAFELLLDTYCSIVDSLDLVVDKFDDMNYG